MLDILPVDLIGSLLCEWLASHKELVKLDCALVNVCIRGKYLQALKNTNKTIFNKNARLKNERQFSNLISWKDKRGLIIPKLGLEYYNISMGKYFGRHFL